MIIVVVCYNNFLRAHSLSYNLSLCRLAFFHKNSIYRSLCAVAALQQRRASHRNWRQIGVGEMLCLKDKYISLHSIVLVKHSTGSCTAHMQHDILGILNWIQATMYADLDLDDHRKFYGLFKINKSRLSLPLNACVPHRVCRCSFFFLLILQLLLLLCTANTMNYVCDS